MSSIDRTKTLEELEQVVLPYNDFGSHVVQESQRLRKLPLAQLKAEDLRLLIGQKIGLPFLVPIALEHLQVNPLTEGAYYQGDLLASVLAVPTEFWAEHAALNNSVVELCADVRQIHQTLSDLLPSLQSFQYR